MCTLLHILYILYTYTYTYCTEHYFTPIISWVNDTKNAIHSATVLLYHTHTHPHYRILMGHLVSFLPHLPRHPPSLLRPYTPHLPTRHSKSPLVMNNSQQFLLDFTHTHTNSQQTYTCMYCVCPGKCSK